jgi:cytochrome c
MKKSFGICGCILIVSACNNNKTQKPNIDTAPVSSQTKNDFSNSADTLGSRKNSTTGTFEAGSNLMSQSDCLGCHKVSETNIGPSYVAIAKKYPPTRENINRLTSAIRNGSKGVWGQVPMQPHPSISQEDAKKMINYILSLRNIN